MSSNHDGSLGVLLIYALLAGVVWFALSGRHSSLRYELQYSVPAEKVSISKRPTDCDFLTAPIGRKHCDYKKIVTVAKFDKDQPTGRPVYSTDGGNTWHWNDGGASEGLFIHVSWERQLD